MSGFEIELPSSPDPLGDEDHSDSAPVPPSTTRRLLHSAVSSRFSARPGTSPRKQMFALDVGTEITPRTIFVTVEAGQDGSTATRAPMVGSGVQRRLFGGSPTPQPSPQRRIRTTTTTVPLRGLSDDEAGPTPGRRRRSSTGRPGTPAKSAAKKRKKSTPTPKATKKTPKKPRGSHGPNNDDVDILQADTPVVTPRTRRGRPPKRKLPEDPANEDDPSATQTLPRKKGRRPRDALGPDDLEAPVDESSTGLEPESRQVERSLSGSNEVAEKPLQDADPEDGLDAGEAEDDRDMWLDNPSDQAAVYDQRDGQADYGAFSPHNVEVPPVDHAHWELDDQGILPGKSDDYAPMMDNEDRSDVESQHSEHVLPEAARNPDELEDQGLLPGESDDYAPMMDNDDRNDVETQHSEHVLPEAERNPDELEDQGSLPGESDDCAPGVDYDDQVDEDSHDFRDPADFRDELDHTVDPESFTMIGLESMQSFRGSRKVAASDPAEIGEDTSLFINKTLESLRQEIAESDEDEVDLLVSADHSAAESGSERQPPANLSARVSLSVGQSPPNRPFRHSSRSPGRAESAGGSVAQIKRHEHAKSPARTIASPKENGMRSKTDELTDDEDSFSDIPEEILAAAESDENLHYQALGPSQQEVGWTVSFDNVSNHSVASSRDQDHGGLQDSHATPSHHNQSHEDGDQDGFQQSASRSAQSRRSNQLAEGDSPPHSLRSRADSNRLLTPDATTSSSTQSPPGQQHDLEEDEGHMVPDDVGSSPPEITTFIEQNERSASPSRRDSDTPANVGPEIHVEHVQERRNFAAILQPGLLGGSRPTLSPVVRIGRTLQNILSDPPSPSGASSFLGSPFKGSVRNSSPLEGAAVDEASYSDSLQGGSASDGEPQHQPADPAPQVAEEPVQSPGKSWAMSLAPLSSIKNLVSQVFTSPTVNVSQVMEDPFAPSSPTLDKALDNTRNSAFMERIRHASREGSRPGSRVGRKVAESDHNEHHVANAGSPSRSGVVGLGRPSKPISAGSEAPPRVQRRPAATQAEHNGAFEENADELASHRSATGLERSRVEEHSSDITISQRSDDGDQSGEEQGIGMENQWQARDFPLSSTTQHQEPEYGGSSDEGDDDDVRMGERRRVDNSPSNSTMQQRGEDHLDSGAEEDDMEQDEAAAQMESVPDRDTPVDDEDDEDIWAIEADRTASSPRFAASQHDTSSLFRKSELSVDWGTRSTNSQGAANAGRSPAFNSRRSIHNLPPEDLEDYSLVDLHSGTPAQPSAKKPTPESQREPKQVDLSDFFSSSPNFIERQRRAKKASLAKSGPRSAPGKPTQIQPTTRVLSPAQGASQDTRRSSELVSSSASPEQARHRVLGPRTTPRRAQNDAALFETWSVSSRAPTERAPSSEASSTPRAVTPLARDSSSFESPELRPLPGRAASPSKSCLRSPLKPKTPGRLVEFTSSTLSETAPLQAIGNSQRNHPAASIFSAIELGPPHPDKENQTSAHNEPTPKASAQHHKAQRSQPQQTVDSPLSHTRWSRDHWLYLDDLWNEYRDSPLEFQHRYGHAVEASPSERPSNSLLGKVVTNQGETVELQQMHLDVVDAFKSEVGGWDEESLAKRLFALIVGTERRRLGLVPARR